jgi:DNA ligase-1
MLASPGASLDAALADLGADVTVEFKLDGARIQVHRDGDDVRCGPAPCARSPTGVPELVAQVRALPCDTAVLDGETLALDDDGRPRAFQDTMSRFGSDTPDAGVLLSPFCSTCCTSTAATCSTSRYRSASTRWPAAGR